tara:strand:- start:483 stop:935 length:453 start_codon:yes stop_codon:yes gene_type:complete
MRDYKMKYKFQDTYLHFEPEMLICEQGNGMLSWIKNNKDMLKDMKGVYYYISNAETIYIGKAKDLYQRMMHHCKEMLPHLCTESKRNNDKKWIDAFSQFAKEEVKVYFIPIEDELDRQWLERNMQLKYETVFKHAIQNKNKNYEKNIPRK